MDEILNESDQYKILMLTLFNLYDNYTLSIVYLQEYFGLSRYKFNVIFQELLSELEVDIKKFENVNIIADGDIIKWNNITNSYIQFKRVQYVGQSEKFELLQYIFMYDKNISEFIEENHVSRTKAYRITSELNEILRDYHISLGSSRFKGDEIEIRNILYQIYYNFFSERNIPFEKDTLEYIDRFVYGLMKTDLFTNRNISQTQIKKIKFFVGVSHIRMKHEYYIRFHDEIDIKSSGYHKMQALFSSIHKLVNTDYIIENEEIIDERNCFYEFLRLNISNIELPTIFKNYDMEVLNATRDFFVILEERGILKDADSKRVYNYVLKINERLKKFPWIPFTFNTRQQRQFFEENYYCFHSIVSEFLSNEFYKKMKLSAIVYNSIYYDLLLGLIELIPQKNLRSEVYVYVDFSRGEMYTDYISKNIKNYQDLNIIVQNQYDDSTDILVSDIDLVEVNCGKIIWKNPPSSTDWKIFADKVLEIKKEKVR